MNAELVAEVSGAEEAPRVYEPACPVTAHPVNVATPALAANGLAVQLIVAPPAGCVAMDSAMDALDPVTTLLN